MMQGCDDHRVGTSPSGHFLNWLVISGAAALLGTGIALVRRRRPSLRSFAVWCSTGVLELAIPASWYIAPNYLAIPLLAVAGFAVLSAVPAGVSLARPRMDVNAVEASAATTGS